jgi:hypothetical protein
VGLKLNGIHQLLVYAHYFNLLEDNTNITSKIPEIVTDASKKNGLEVETTKYLYTCMLLSRHKNTGQNLDMKIANRSFENVAQFKYLVTIVTDQILSDLRFSRR